MTTPSPTDIGVPWEIFWSVVGGLLGVLGTVLLLLYKSTNRRIKEKADASDKGMVQLGKELDKVTAALTEQVNTTYSTVEERLDTYFKAHERLRDKWDDFLREYLKIDSTRGQKVDALFRVVDQMQKAVEHIPRNMNEKIEEAFTHSLSELKLYARDQIQAAIRDLEGKNGRRK
jgi:hypothetical protein